MADTDERTDCEHGRPRDDCPLCEPEEELDDVLVDVETWAEAVLLELGAARRR